MYTRDKKDYMKKDIENALLKYAEDINNVGAGYHILRYTAQGFIASTETSVNEFIDWYPRNTAYIILRLAAKGKLIYKSA